MAGFGINAFAKQVGISLKQRLKERGYRFVDGMNAEARIKITSMGSKEYLVQYVSGDQTWSVQIHIAQATPEAANIAVDLLMTEMFQDMQKRSNSSSGSQY